MVPACEGRARVAACSLNEVNAATYKLRTGPLEVASRQRSDL